MNTRGILNHTLVLICLGASSLLATGCGKSIVTGVGVSSSVQSGDQYASVFADFNTSGMTLPSVTLPIFNPESPSTTYGSVVLNSPSSNSAQVTINIDLTVIAKLPAGGTPTLPNGVAVPVSGTEQTQVLSIPVPTTKFVIYVALNINVLQPGQSPVAMVGIAMPFTQFDSIGASLGNTDLFIPFNISGIAGTAGVFTGKASGTSGLGIFIDASGLIQSVSPQPSPSALASEARAESATQQGPAKLDYLSTSPGSSNKSKIENELSNLGADHTELTID